MSFEQPPFIAHDVANARRHLLDKIEEHRAAGGAPVTIVWCNLGNASLNALVEAGEIGRVLSEMDAFVAENNAKRDDLKNTVVSAMRDNRQLTIDGREAVVSSLVWLLCRGPQGEMVERFAREGGGAMGYEITTRPAPDGGEYANFRTLVQQHILAE